MFIRSRWWIEQYGIQPGIAVPINISELGLSGLATINELEECVPIASGEGNVVTGRFKTARVDVLVRLEVAGPKGNSEVLEGTTVHPVWSVDRQDWIPLSELLEGERLQAEDGIALVQSIELVHSSAVVYNIKVHGEHVYQVGEMGLVAHNMCVAITKALNNGIVHASERAVQRMPHIFTDLKQARAALEQLTAGIRAAKQFPPGTIPDPRRLDSVLVPFHGGWAVYEVAKNGVAKLWTVIF